MTEKNKAEKTEAQLLKERLFYEPKNIYASLSDDEAAKVYAFAEEYKAFMNVAKTEREVTCFMREKAKALGFVEFDPKKKYAPGDRVFAVNREKCIILCTFGKRALSEGVKIAAAHIDSPRLDLKPNPVYEAEEMAFFKTHYYGGIKKYQWTALPLSLHGVLMKKNGEKLSVNIGEAEGEPLFVITDLLPHLGREQLKRTAAEAVKGEELNILIASRPFRDDKESELVKLNVLKLLNEKYGIEESDFLSAELNLVPAFKASDIGFDRSLIGAYGHDDKCCAYPAARAAFDISKPEYTVVTVLTDKEETGSDGNTGLNSSYFEYFIHDLAENAGLSGRAVLSKSECLSADVNAAFDPSFPDVMEKKNASYINKGVVVTKYTGGGGKYDTSDASAEYMGKIRSLLDDKKVSWQIGELGKVDAGGGGTVAKYIANLNVDVVDVGLPVLSMHSPFEVIAKTDLYMAYRAFCEFFGMKN